METRKKKLPIGIENFEEIRTKGFYYVDKTGLIKELLENWGKVTLFTKGNLVYPPEKIREISKYEYAEKFL